MSVKVAVIGGGAAGFFFAINLAKRTPNTQIAIFEKSNKVLAKVKVSGGGRCNVTNATFHANQLVDNYPRGKNFLKRVFQEFAAKDTVEWFDREGVELKIEPDKRMFPTSDSSQTIIDCFLYLIQKLQIDVHLHTSIESIEKKEDKFVLNGQQTFDYLYVATGGSPKIEGYHLWRSLGHTIVPPLPSLFTFNVPNHPFSGLEGVSFTSAKVKIEKSSLQSEGPLLITHWGFSGPAILRLSAWGAKELAEKQYDFTAFLNFVPELNAEKVREELTKFKEANRNKLIASHRQFNLTSRFWERLVNLSGIAEQIKWGDISKAQLNKLVENLSNCSVVVKGKTTFKEEFVTCGGISLEEVNANSLESKVVPNLFFGGEVLDIDGITGGFNFQSAWSTAWIAAKEVAKRMES